MPESSTAWMAASACWGVLLLCDQSTIVVIPESSASSIAIRLAAYMSAGS
jgi:hypothetical protein